MKLHKIIKSEKEHELALERLVELMDKDPANGTPDADEIELLALLIDHFESEKYPIDPPSPIEAIKFRMDQMGLKDADMIQYLGSRSKVSEVLNGKQSLSITMIKKLHKGLGISSDILIQDPEKIQIEYKVSFQLDGFIDQVDTAVKNMNGYMASQSAVRQLHLLGKIFCTADDAITSNITVKI